MRVTLETDQLIITAEIDDDVKSDKLYQYLETMDVLISCRYKIAEINEANKERIDKLDPYFTCLSRYPNSTPED